MDNDKDMEIVLCSLKLEDVGYFIFENKFYYNTDFNIGGKDMPKVTDYNDELKLNEFEAANETIIKNFVWGHEG